MHPQLRDVVQDFERAGQRVDALAARLGEAAWRARPVPERWSPLECIAHLNLTSLAMLPLIRDGIAEARASGRPAPTRYRRDVRGWLLWYAVKTPGRFRTRTTASFVPSADRPVAEVLDEFRRLRAEQVACVGEADGLAIDKVFIGSPFNARMRYNVYSAFIVMAAHEHRHIAQAGG
jgi:hypothetical protein